MTRARVRAIPVGAAFLLERRLAELSSRLTLTGFHQALAEWWTEGARAPELVGPLDPIEYAIRRLQAAPPP